MSLPYLDGIHGLFPVSSTSRSSSRQTGIQPSYVVLIRVRGVYFPDAVNGKDVDISPQYGKERRSTMKATEVRPHFLPPSCQI